MTMLPENLTMDPQQKEALRSLRLSWAPTADDMWHSQGAVHVGGVHDQAMSDVMDAFDDAAHTVDSNPLGVVLRGSAGSGIRSTRPANCEQETFTSCCDCTKQQPQGSARQRGASQACR